MTTTNQPPFDTQSVEDKISFLQQLVNDPTLLGELTQEQRKSLLVAAGQLSRPDKFEIQKRSKAIKKKKQRLITQNDRRARAQTGIRSARTLEVFTAPLQLPMNRCDLDEESLKLKSARRCYVCRASFDQLHHFYDSMCLDCAEFNYQKRFQTADLSGQVALITGSRLKIGYQATVMMLRAGAKVIATTRFPNDSAVRFAKESDFDDWKHNLDIYGLDLRHTPSVEIFARYFEQKYDRLDILINNAAQTVRRPPGFYSHMMDIESQKFEDFNSNEQLLLKNHHQFVGELNSLSDFDMTKETALPVAWHGQSAGIGIRASAQLSQIPYSFDNSITAAEVFPQGRLDADLQQVDLRKTNSWRLRMGEIETPEMLEVQLVNSVAPFVLCNRLVPMMRRDYTGKKHIVNVSAMEGKFKRFKKEDRHPHTNMAKAALNMMTHTSASDLALDGIYMNAVDTGWVTDEDPAHLAELKQDIHDFQPPLDIVDGAARVCDPFFDGILTGKHWCGKFLKDYRPIDW